MTPGAERPETPKLSGDERAAYVKNFFEAMASLPPSPQLVFHGVQENPGSFTLQGVLSASADPRVGTNNFSTPVILAIASRTGRSIRGASHYPWQYEWVLLPESDFRVVAASTRLIEGFEVVLVDQYLEDPGFTAAVLPSDPDLLWPVIEKRIVESLASDEVPLPVPGKFVDEIW
jgi:hypothetical protein